MSNDLRESSSLIIRSVDRVYISVRSQVRIFTNNGGYIQQCSLSIRFYYQNWFVVNRSLNQHDHRSGTMIM